MITFKTVLVVAAMAAVAGAAQAEPTAFAAFSTVCGDTRAAFAAVGSAADGKGWHTAQQMGGAAMAGVTVADRLSRANKLGDAPLALSAWHGATKSGIQVSDCTVRVDKTDYAQEIAGAQAWTGFSAQETAARKAIFRFTDIEGVRRGLASGEYDAAAAGPGMEILTITSDSQGTTLDLLRIKK